MYVWIICSSTVFVIESKDVTQAPLASVKQGAVFFNSVVSNIVPGFNPFWSLTWKVKSISLVVGEVCIKVKAFNCCILYLPKLVPAAVSWYKANSPSETPPPTVQAIVALLAGVWGISAPWAFIG